jgi:hypothetical protein
MITEAFLSRHNFTRKGHSQHEYVKDLGTCKLLVFKANGQAYLIEKENPFEVTHKGKMTEKELGDFLEKAVTNL